MKRPIGAPLVGEVVVMYVNRAVHCMKHGVQWHMGYLHGACCICYQEGLVRQGLVKP